MRRELLFHLVAGLAVLVAYAPVAWTQEIGGAEAKGMAEPGTYAALSEALGIAITGPGRHTISSSTTVTAALRIPPGVMLSVSAGQTLTLCGAFEAGFYQVFTGPGYVVGFDKGITERVLPHWWGMSTTASAATNAAAIMSAIQALNRTGGAVYGPNVQGGDVHIPAGVYHVAPDVININAFLRNQYNITISGAASAYSYHTTTAATTLVFGPGSVGIALTNMEVPDPKYDPSGTPPGSAHVTSASSYSVLKNLALMGNGCATGVRADGMSVIEHSYFANFAYAGLWLFNYVNMASVHHCSFVGMVNGSEDAYGILIGQQYHASALDYVFGYNTLMNLSNLVVNGNRVGMRVTGAQGARFRDIVLEDNQHEAIQIYRYSTAMVGQPVDSLVFDSLWLEHNAWDTTDWSGKSLSIDSEIHNTISAVPSNIKFRDSIIGAGNVHWGNSYRASFENCGDGYIYEGATDFADPQPSVYGSPTEILGTGIQVSVPSGLLPGTPATTIYTLPASAMVRYYMVFARISAPLDDATNYSAYAIIAADFRTARIMHQVDGGLLTITLSGMKVQVNQGSGSIHNVELLITTYFPIR